ncbi:MAG: Adaptive-response sensory-kinase SasA [Syntrophus sp. SKADARSKE-3]|nr:Adaptive-response sensory-kinase SasA [Syntrophus sp. SKADARSKE-3]
MVERFQNFIARIKAFKRLPTLPSVLIRLVEICNDENTNFQELSKILATDAGLSSRVLYLANSSYYRNQEKIAHIDQALLRMGRNTVKNLVFSAAVHQVFTNQHGHDALHLKKFWRHSLLTAILARLLAVKIGYHELEQAFFAGMVHDIGRLVLSANFPDAYKNVLDISPHESQLLIDEEMKIGAPHTEVGAWLLGKWNLDSFTVDAILYHHEPARRIADALPLVRIVHGANILAEMTESADVRCEDVMAFFSMDFEETTDLIVQAEEEMETVAQSLGMDIEHKEHKTSNKEIEEEKKSALVGSVGNMAMLFGTLRSLTESADEDAMIKALHEGVRVLFDSPEVMLFLYDGEKQVLVNNGDPFAGRLTLPLTYKSSLPVRCLQEAAILSSLDGKEGGGVIVDEQLARRMGKKGIVCAPLMVRSERVGVVAIGLDKEEAACLQNRMQLLKMFTNVVAMALDTDRLRRNYTRRVHAEKMAAVHALMRRIAHEINNPLGIIKNYLSILDLKVESTGSNGDSTGQKEIRIIREEIDRITRILPELSVSENAKARDKVPVDINLLISDMTNMIGKAAAEQRGIKILLQLEPAIPKVSIDRDGIKQVLLNLIKNAVEAMTQGGTIMIETSLLSGSGAGDPFGSVQEIQIKVHDDGPGIEPSIMARLFEPCVSTKGKGHSGIGLSIVYEIMKGIGGSITCESLPGRGTAFFIRLPVTV